MSELQDIKYFESLPDEILLQVCSNLDSSTLARFMQTSQRIHDVCSEVLDPSYFSELPNDVLLQFCEQMETPVLLRLSESYSRGRQVCSKEILKRKFIQQFINKINRPQMETVFEYKRDYPEAEIQLEKRFAWGQNVLSVDQVIYFEDHPTEEELANLDPWIFSRPPVFETFGDRVMRGGFIPITPENLQKIATYLIKYGYVNLN